MSFINCPGKRRLAGLLAIACFLLLPGKNASGQTISILGANCVVAGTQYIYHITGSYLNATTKSWSVVGGTISGAANGTQVTVTWTTGSSRSISINTTGPTGYGNMSIGFSSALVPGTISNTTQSINNGAVPATINCSAPSGGDCGTPTYTYQWQSSPTGTSGWTDISGATSQNLSFSSGLTQTTYYQRNVTVTSTGGTGVSTNKATVTVYPAIVPGSVNPATQATINYGANASTLTLSGVSGGTNSYTYQWQSSPNGTGSWTNISGATGTTYTPTALTATTYYHVVVTSNGASATSSSATVTVYPQIVAGSISPSAPNINYNTSPGTLTLSGVSGGSGTYTYQWQSSPDGSSWTNVSGATSTTYTPPSLTATIRYRVVVTSNSATGNSIATIVNVYQQLQPGGVSPSTQSINYGATATMSTTGVSGGTGIYTYRWLNSSSPVSGFGDISGATSPTYTTPGLTVTTYYQLEVTSNGVVTYSTVGAVNVYPQLAGGSISPNGGQIGLGGSTGTMTLSGVSGGNGTYTYQWQSSPNGSTWTTIGGATATTYSAANVTISTYYHVVVTSNGASANSASVLFTVNTADNLNYIRTREILKPLVTDIATANGLTSNQDAHQTTQYFDGLGRLMQTVSKQSTPAGQDEVAMTVYDQYGREATKYLPYVSELNDGFYKLNASADQSSFNTAQFPGEQYYYSNISFEASPLNRPLVTYAPGINWVGASRGVTQQYLFNQTSDSVRIWDIAAASGSIPRTDSMYRPGALSKMQTTDEAGHLVIEYNDKNNRTVLKKVQLATSPGTAHVGWLNTYYVYDSLANLRFVIQPRAIDLLQANGTWNLSSLTNLTNELCFRYEYDNRNRMIIKKVPGAGEVWMVYDSWDRLVLTQDANLRTTNQWLFTKYDALDRPVLTGFYTDATHNTQALMQSYLTSQGLGRYESRSTGVQLGYTTTQSFPSLPAMTYSTTDWMTISFYDDYSGGNLFGSTYYTRDNSKDGSFTTASNTAYPYPQTVSEVTATRALPTITIARILGSSNSVYHVSFYDSRGRVIQVKTFTGTEATDVASSQYSFDGKPLETVDYHQKAGTNAQNHTVITKMTYDAGNRLSTIKKNIDAAPSDQLISTNTYNELGQLQNKQLGNNLDNLAYAYNVRGWLTSINKNFLAGTQGNYFGMELGYDKSTSAAGATYTGLQYNGNIAGTVWKTAGDGIGRKYDFTYDNVNRLSAATFTQNEGSGFAPSATMNFNVSNLGYDGNGNITSMNQMGFKVGGSATIDQLSYVYQPNSNKLAKVTDAVSDATTKLGDFHDGTNGATDDYSYDANGNLTLDNNKAISSITYNYLNLPQVITVTSKGTITYTYDATGSKIKKTTVDNTASPSKTTTTLYYGGFVYQQDTLQFIAHEEGRARWAYHKYTNGYSAYGFEYDYFEKDHLGNTRVLLTQQKDTAKYLASGEAAYRSTEPLLFTNLVETATSRATAEGYPTDVTITNPNDTVFKVNGTTGGHKMGPSLLLKVMSGDKIDIAVQEYYNTGTTTTPNSSVTDVLASLATGVVNMTSGGKGSLTDLNNTGASPIYAALNSFMPTNDPNTSGKPKAYLNWILLDEQLKYVSSYPQSGAVVAGSAGTINTLSYTGIPITKSGYLYIWVSNETPNWNVFFDNLRVAHYTGPMLEETHYYPFGLTMAGISSKALKPYYTENKYRWNKGSELQNKEFSDGSGLEMYETHFRELDPQLGRWWQIDPKPDESQTLYGSMDDDPILRNDPDGDCPTCLIGALIGAVVDVAVQVSVNMANGQSFSTAVHNINGTQVAIAAATGFVTSGVSAIYSSAAATGTTLAVSEATVQAGVVGTASVVSQVNDNMSKGQSAMNISPVKVALDIATDHVATNISKGVPTTSTTAAERQLNRAERIASNDPKSSGRAANVQQAQNKVNRIKTSNTVKQTAVSNTISSTASAVTGSSNSRSQMGSTAPIPKQDATALKKPYIIRL
ncbi:MAG TPA: DUF6443 domain-containing protein [Puia sp.]|nr:DUF6443 domain-containing protein [Puia sp.]